MGSEVNNKNPFAGAKTKEEKDVVWKSLRAKSRRLNKEEADRMMKEAIRLRKNEE